MLEVLHPTRLKNEGKSGRKHLELSERRRAFARKKRRGKQAERKAARMKTMFSRIFLYHSLPFLICVERTSNVSPFPDGGFLPCDHGLGFEISLCENSINQLIKVQLKAELRDNKSSVIISKIKLM